MGERVDSLEFVGFKPPLAAFRDSLSEMLLRAHSTQHNDTLRIIAHVGHAGCQPHTHARR
jgi:hypothetical protein